MARYLINVLASQDLNDIADYFAQNNIRAGEKFFQDFNRKCRQFVLFPSSGKNYEDIYPNLRGVPLAGYIIFYRIIDDDIEILRVISGRRNLPSIFQGSE
ncbi:MAG: type II toxin-antitoxin system RelE/ParE family toxin [Cyanobacteria bacterium J06592_8]